MKSEALRLSQSRERIVIYGVVRDILTNPIVALLVGLAVVEAINWQDGKYESGSTRVWARSAVKTVALVDAIAPSIPAIAGAATDIVGSVTKAIPGVAGLLLTGGK